MPQATVKLFASLTDHFGSGEICVELPDGANASDLKAALAALKPEAKASLDRSRVAQNHNFLNRGDAIDTSAELALIPPVSGG